MTYIHFADPSLRDPFGRFRISETQSPLDCKFLQDEQPYINDTFTVGGGNITYVFNEAMVHLGVGTASGDRCVRESRRYCPYAPGNGLASAFNAVLGAAKSNVVSRAGLFNDNNGYFFERNATDVRVVIRSNTSGSPSDANFFTQANWNVDRLDGTGSSGYVLDVTQGLKFMIDYSGTFGKVRFGIDFGSKVVYCHEYVSANIVSVPAVRRPSLPIRYEILNTGVSASSTIMKQGNYSVKTEGPNAVTGLSFGVNLNSTPIAVTTRQPILAIRLANTYRGNINRRQLRIEQVNLYTKTNDCLFEFGHVHADWTSTTGGSWVAVDPYSGAEVNKGITAITGGTQHSVQSFYLPAGQGQASNTIRTDVDIIGSHAWINQNIDSTKSSLGVIWATSLSGTANVLAALDFSEIE